MNGLIDCHNHSLHSFDGSESVETMCERAEAIGLFAFAVTDHCDLNMLSREEAQKTVAASVSGLQTYRENHPEAHCRFLCGVELGEPAENFSFAEEVLSWQEYDIVIGSVHNAPGILDFYFLDYDQPLDVDTLLRSYFSLVFETVRWGKFDTLAHLTYPLRYLSEHGIPVQLGTFFDEIDAIFRLLIERGISLECNTSGLRQKIGEPMPCAQLLRRYRKLGGELITLGSDAHRSVDVSSGITECTALLASLGFRTVNYYKGRKPLFVMLDH